MNTTMSRRRVLRTATVVAALSMTTNAAHAVFIGVSVQLHTAVNISGFGEAWVMRLYANFSGTTTTENVSNWGASPKFGPTTIQQVATPGGGAGSGFYNHQPFGGTAAPVQALVDFAPDLEWDTFGTIGLAIQPGTQSVISMLPEGGLFPDHILQGTGGSNNSFAFAVFGQPDFSQVGDDGRVLLAQFTVRAGEHVRGTVSRVAGFEDTGLPLLQPYARFGGVFVTPAPGALALFAFAALTGSRRRRSEE